MFINYLNKSYFFIYFYFDDKIYIGKGFTVLAVAEGAISKEVAAMSKKEQKLKKDLYKALTEYFIHNTKNSLASSESILDQLASFRMETGLPAALRQDKKYQKAQKNCNKANEKMQDLNLTPQQWDTIDTAITAENNASIEYIRIAYKQGIIDAFSILRETL